MKPPVAADNTFHAALAELDADIALWMQHDEAQQLAAPQLTDTPGESTVRAARYRQHACNIKQVQFVDDSDCRQRGHTRH